MDELEYQGLREKYESYLAEEKRINDQIRGLLEDNPEFFQRIKDENLMAFVQSARKVPVGWGNQE